MKQVALVAVMAVVGLLLNRRNRAAPPPTLPQWMLADGATVTESDIYREVVEAFRRLLDDGRLRVESSTYSARSFGDATVVLVAPEFRIRLSRDRGEPDVDVSSTLEPKAWHNLAWVIAAVNGAAPPRFPNVSPRDAADIVNDQFDQIRAGLTHGWLATRSTLERFEEDSVREDAGEEGLRELEKARQHARESDR